MTLWLADWYQAKSLGQKARQLARLRLKNLAPVIGIMKGLTDPMVGLLMGQTAENLAYRFGITRQQMDAFSVRSHQRVAAAQDAGYLAAGGGEIEALYDTDGKAYTLDDGVYYDISTFDSYGHLSGQSLEELRSGVRVQVIEGKRNPGDFVLWKYEKPGEPSWESPWGRGRPGWHIECSVMSGHYLGPSFDIHGGGEDLLFPHHENERAQSVAATGGEFARYWVHNGFVTVESEKMSKSLGNFLTIRDALKSYHPEVLRFFLLSKHYRTPLDFAKSAVLDLQSGLVRIYRTVQRANSLLGRTYEKWSKPMEGSLAEGEEDTFFGRFIEAMDEDLNTPNAIALIFEKVTEMNKAMDSGLDDTGKKALAKDLEHLYSAAKVLGILGEDPEDFFEKVAAQSDAVDPAVIQRLIAERAEARAGKDWARADAIREELKSMGIVLEDGPKGTTWRHDV